MKAIKIKMKPGCGTSKNLLEIHSIYIQGKGFFAKENIYDYLKKEPGTIQVNIDPYPNVIPAISDKGEKYVKSSPNNSLIDNLLNLPRE